MSVEILTQKGYKFLWIDDNLWMWDIPQEQRAQQEIANQAYGDVLVVGYGLGLVQEYLIASRRVNTVTTIEILKEVIQANKDLGIANETYTIKAIHGGYIIGNFFDMTDVTGKYDCIIGDIWMDILPGELAKYKRFKTKAFDLLKPNGKILAWGGDYFEYLIEKGKACST